MLGIFEDVKYRLARIEQVALAINTLPEDFFYSSQVISRRMIEVGFQNDKYEDNTDLTTYLSRLRKKRSRLGVNFDSHYELRWAKDIEQELRFYSDFAFDDYRLGKRYRLTSEGRKFVRNLISERYPKNLNKVYYCNAEFADDCDLGAYRLRNYSNCLHCSRFDLLAIRLEKFLKLFFDSNWTIRKKLGVEIVEKLGLDSVYNVGMFDVVDFDLSCLSVESRMLLEKPLEIFKNYLKDANEMISRERRNK